MEKKWRVVDKKQPRNWTLRMRNGEKEQLVTDTSVVSAEVTCHFSKHPIFPYTMKHQKILRILTTAWSFMLFGFGVIEQNERKRSDNYVNARWLTTYTVIALSWLVNETESRPISIKIRKRNQWSLLKRVPDALGTKCGKSNFLNERRKWIAWLNK